MECESLNLESVCIALCLFQGSLSLDVGIPSLNASGCYRKPSSHSHSSFSHKLNRALFRLSDHVQNCAGLPS